MASVDDVWAEMQADDAARRREILKRQKRQGAGLGMLGTAEAAPRPQGKKKGKRSKKGKKSATLATGTGVRLPEAAVLRDEEPDDGAMDKAPSHSNVFYDAEDLLRHIQRDVNTLGSDSYSARKWALKRLSDLLIHTSQPPGVMNDLFPDLMKPLLKRIGDGHELLRFIPSLEDVATPLPYILSAVFDRVPDTYSLDTEMNTFSANPDELDARRRGKAMPTESHAVHKVLETSEEMRLLLWRVVGAVVDAVLRTDCVPVMQPYFADTVVFLQAGARDPFADVKLQAFATLRTLAAAVPYALKHFAVALVRVVMTSLDHRHARVRLAALDAVHDLVACPDIAKQRGAGTEAIVDLMGHRDANVIPVSAFYGHDVRVNYIGKLMADDNPTVRLRLTDVVGDWLHALPDRYDHAPRLNVFLVSGLSDENPGVREAALAWIDRLGSAHEAENREDIIERVQYGVDGDAESRYDGPLPHPFTGRPRVGMRLVILSHGRRFFKAIANELDDWIGENRARAAHLLSLLLIFMEEHVMMELPQLLGALMKGSASDEIGARIGQCCELLGRFLPPTAYLPIVLPHVQGDLAVNPNADAQSQGRALAALEAMLRGAPPQRLLPSLRDLTATLDALDGLTDAGNLALKAGAVRLVATIGRALSEGEGSRSAVAARFAASGRLADLRATRARLVRVLMRVQGRAVADASPVGEGHPAGPSPSLPCLGAGPAAVDSAALVAAARAAAVWLAAGLGDAELMESGLSPDAAASAHRDAVRLGTDLTEHLRDSLPAQADPETPCGTVHDLLACAAAVSADLARERLVRSLLSHLLLAAWPHYRKATLGAEGGDDVLAHAPARRWAPDSELRCVLTATLHGVQPSAVAAAEGPSTPVPLVADAVRVAASLVEGGVADAVHAVSSAGEEEGGDAPTDGGEGVAAPAGGGGEVLSSLALPASEADAAARLADPALATARGDSRTSACVTSLLRSASDLMHAVLDAVGAGEGVDTACAPASAAAARSGLWRPLSRRLWSATATPGLCPEALRARLSARLLAEPAAVAEGDASWGQGAWPLTCAHAQDVHARRLPEEVAVQCLHAAARALGVCVATGRARTVSLGEAESLWRLLSPLVDAPRTAVRCAAVRCLGHLAAVARAASPGPEAPEDGAADWFVRANLAVTPPALGPASSGEPLLRAIRERCENVEAQDESLLEAVAWAQGQVEGTAA